MFRGYLNEPERYKKCFAGGFYLTGDLARKDRDGYYWFVGRKDDVIKTSGHLVGPFEVESTMMEHQAGAETEQTFLGKKTDEWQYLNIIVEADKPGEYMFSFKAKGPWHFHSCEVTAWRK